MRTTGHVILNSFTKQVFLKVKGSYNNLVSKEVNAGHDMTSMITDQSPSHVT